MTDDGRRDAAPDRVHHPGRQTQWDGQNQSLASRLTSTDGDGVHLAPRDADVDDQGEVARPAARLAQQRPEPTLRRLASAQTAERPAVWSVQPRRADAAFPRLARRAAQLASDAGWQRQLARQVQLQVLPHEPRPLAALRGQERQAALTPRSARQRLVWARSVRLESPALTLAVSECVPLAVLRRAAPRRRRAPLRALPPRESPPRSGGGVELRERTLPVPGLVQVPPGPQRHSGDGLAWPVRARPFRRAHASPAPIAHGCAKPGRPSAASNGCEPGRPSGAAMPAPRLPRYRTHPPCHAHEACSTRPPTAKRASRRLPGLPRLRRHGYRAPAPDLRFQPLPSSHVLRHRPTQPHSPTRPPAHVEL